VLRSILVAWIRGALWFRYRKITLVFHSPLSTDQPAILAGNHQNALLDTLTLASRSPEGPYILSRGSLFDTKLARRILGSLRAIPIYRFRDGFGKMRQNPEMFGQFAEVLGKNGWLLIFPEGGHHLRYGLRPFQKGVARIVFAAQEAEGWQREIPVIPVGLQYDDPATFGSRLLIQYGTPLSTLEYRDLHSRNPREAERALVARLFQAIRALLVLPPQEEEAYGAVLRRWSRNRGRFGDLTQQLEADRALLEGEAAERHGPDRRRFWRKLAGYALSLPALILHLPVAAVLWAWEKAFFKDRDLAPAARFVVGLFLVPAWYLAALALGAPLEPSPLAVLLLATSMPFSLWLRSRTWHWTR
jgi:1-acyl-sn-glycerol-3-phosphate acyltransferase